MVVLMMINRLLIKFGMFFLILAGAGVADADMEQQNQEGSYQHNTYRKKTDLPVATSSKVFTFNGLHRISGKVQKVKFFGPPGYGDDPKHDQKFTAYVLKLSEPIKVVENDQNEFNYTTETTEVQLSFFDFQIEIEKAAQDQQIISVKGEFFSAHTGYHIRKLLMIVKSVH